tara:strand:- start:97 stop:384 length:288 start_codon:yes stop_codon:yes gene_type:complete
MNKASYVSGFIYAEASEEKLLKNIDSEVSNFLSGLFEKYNIKLEDNLNDFLGLEHDYYELLKDFEQFIKDSLECNKQIKKLKNDLNKLHSKGVKK